MIDDAAARLAEDELYTFVYEEIENGHMDKAAQARAIAEGGENEGAVRAAYIKHRIARIRAEIEITERHAAYTKAQEERNDLEYKISNMPKIEKIAGITKRGWQIIFTFLLLLNIIIWGGMVL